MSKDDNIDIIFMTKRRRPATSPSGPPARRGCGRTRRNSPRLSRGSDSRRVFFGRTSDARPRDKGKIKNSNHWKWENKKL